MGVRVQLLKQNPVIVGTPSISTLVNCDGREERTTASRTFSSEKERACSAKAPELDTLPPRPLVDELPFEMAPPEFPGDVEDTPTSEVLGRDRWRAPAPDAVADAGTSRTAPTTTPAFWCWCVSAAPAKNERREPGDASSKRGVVERGACGCWTALVGDGWKLIWRCCSCCRSSGFVDGAANVDSAGGICCAAGEALDCRI